MTNPTSTVERAAAALDLIVAGRARAPYGEERKALEQQELSRAQRLTAQSYLRLAARIHPQLVQASDTVAKDLGEEAFARMVDERIAATPGLILPADPQDLLRTPSRQVVTFVTRAVADALSAGRERKDLHGLEGPVYEHLEDREFLYLLRAVPGIDKALAQVVDVVGRREEVRLLSSNLRVTQASVPQLYDCFIEACRILDVDPLPRFYVEPGPVNAYTVGSTQPTVVVSSGAVSLLTREELLFVIGHELGHIKSQHLLYGMMARWMGQIMEIAGQFTLGLAPLLTSLTIEPALYAWYRRSEYSADRAGLLCCQDLDTAVRTMAKLAGYPPRFYSALDSRTFVDQAREYDRRLNEDVTDRMSLLLLSLNSTHPYTVARVGELLAWVDSGEYSDILDADPDERRAIARTVASDPLLDIQVRRACAAVANWAGARYSVDKKVALRGSRRLLRLREATSRGPFSDVCKVDIEVAKSRHDAVDYRVYILTMGPKGTPEKATLTLPGTTWSSAPSVYRETMIRTGQTKLSFEVFRRT